MIGRLVQTFWRPWQTKGLRASALSTALFAVMNILILRGAESEQDARTINLYVTLQYGIQILSVFVFYGLYFEARQNLKVIQLDYLMVTLLIISLVYPVFAMALLLFVRMTLIKYSRSRMVTPWIFVGVSMVCLWHVKGALTGLYVASIATTYLVFAFCGQTAVAIPTKVAWDLGQLGRTLSRVIVDYVLLLVPLAINALAFRYLMVGDYIIFQKCIASLGAAGLASSFIERKVFDDHLVEGISSVTTAESPLIIAATFGTLAASLIVAALVGVPSALFWGLGACGISAAAFSAELHTIRFRETAGRLGLIAGSWAVLFCALLAVAWFIWPVSANTLLGVMACFTLLKTVSLILLRRRYAGG